MVGLKCRLCSSACALISLSGGKCRKNRDYIRKLVEITTGIKFEKNDWYRYICYPCTIQVYNFYIFKARSLENEERLKTHIEKNGKTKSNKINIPDLSNIALPDTNELRDSLAPWLMSKSKHCELMSSERGNDANKERTSERSRIADNASKTGKTEHVLGIDISIQCHLPQNISDQSTQTDLINTRCDRSTQYMVPNIAIHTQTNDILTKSSQIQCSLFKESRKEDSNRNLDTQLQSMDKATQHYDTCRKCKEIDCKCYVHTLVNIKQEPQLSATPINSLSRNKYISPILSASTPITYPRVPKDTSENEIYCKMCDKILFSKESYMLHKKSHMTCSFCKKKFLSIKRTKLHIDYDCETKKRVDVPTVVQLIKVENLQEAQKNYSKCLEDLKNLQERDSKTLSPLRIRSRSTSSADSFYSCCSLCKNSVTVLHGLRIGIDKSVQTSLLDNQVMSGLVNGDITFKSKFKNVEDLMSPAKKIKLSNSLIE